MTKRIENIILGLGTIACLGTLPLIKALGNEPIKYEKEGYQITVYRDRTEVFTCSPCGGTLLVDRGNDGTLDERIQYSAGFRETGPTRAEVTEADQRRYDGIMGQ